MLEKKDSMPIIKLIPSMVTLFALCVGLGAIKLAILGQFEKAIIFIMVSGFLDGIDGRIARALRSTSEFGAELDSLCDFVNFGIAPSFILYFWHLNSVPLFGWALVLLMSVSLAIRLARFNAALNDDDVDEFKIYAKKNFFVGAPAPVVGMLFLLPLALYTEIQILFNNWVLSLYLIFVCILAVSRIPTFSLKGLKISRKMASIVAIIFSCLMIGLLYEPVKVAIFCCLLYLCIIPFSVYKYLSKRKQLCKII
jgi:CDP-diacylglycerol--serine O-phosphatidyltransferase